MTGSKIARLFLALNAAFSLLAGGVLLAAAGEAARLLFVEPATWQGAVLRLLGGGLVLFGVDLILLATDRFVSRKQVLTITAMDIGWILGSIFLLAAYGDSLSGAGANVVIFVALCVAGFATGQFLGARRMEPPKSKAVVKASGGQLVAKVSRKVRAPEDIVWQVMTDHPRYADVARNISKVEVLSGSGIGMQRRCYGPKGENWLETCDQYEDGRSFGFRIHTDANDYPYPISDLRGRWSVVPSGGNAEFSIDIEAKPSGNVLARGVFNSVAKRQFKGVLVDLADAWADRMEKEARG